MRDLRGYCWCSNAAFQACSTIGAWSRCSFSATRLVVLSHAFATDLISASSRRCISSLYFSSKSVSKKKSLLWKPGSNPCPSHSTEDLKKNSMFFPFSLRSVSWEFRTAAGIASLWCFKYSGLETYLNTCKIDFVRWVSESGIDSLSTKQQIPISE